MRLAWWMVVLAMAGTVGCGPKVPFEEDSDSATAGSDTEPTGGVTITTGGPSTTALPTTTGVTTSASTVTTTGPTSTTAVPTATGPMTATDPTFPTATVSVTGPTTTSTGTTGGAPNGEFCEVNDQCASGFCFFTPVLGGICGECISDDDCPFGGCSSPNPLTGVWAMCNGGEFGDGCDNNDACSPPLLCAEIIDVPGIISEATCGECQYDAQCGGGLCSPGYDIVNLSGAWSCVDVGSVPVGDGCALYGTGDQACATGFCAEADVMGLFSLGVCSGCEITSDCPPNSFCVPPEVDLQFGLVPGYCN